MAMFTVYPMTAKSLENSFKILATNPKLFIPDLIDLILAYGLFIFFIYYTGASDVASLLNGLGEQASAEIVTDFLSTNLSKILISAITYFVLTFLIGVGMVILKFEMINDLLKKKKTSFKKVWKNRNHYFIDVVLLRISIAIYSILFVTVIALISYFLFLLINPFSKEVAIVVSIIVGIILAILAFFIYSFSILFRYPIMFMGKSRRAWIVLPKSLKYFKKNISFVGLTWLVIFVVSFLVGLVGSGVTFVGQTLIDTLFLTISTGLIATIIFSFIGSLIKIIGDLWGNIYLFSRFKERPKV